jgi:hypothetical protein
MFEKLHSTINSIQIDAEDVSVLEFTREVLLEKLRK